MVRIDNFKSRPGKHEFARALVDAVSELFRDRRRTGVPLPLLVGWEFSKETHLVMAPLANILGRPLADASGIDGY